MDVKPAACPCCEEILDAATGVNGRRSPVPGDFTICVYCVSLAIFTETGSLRYPTQEEIDGLEPSNRELMKTIKKIIINRH